MCGRNTPQSRPGRRWPTSCVAHKLRSLCETAAGPFSCIGLARRRCGTAPEDLHHARFRATVLGRTEDAVHRYSIVGTECAKHPHVDKGVLVENRPKCTLVSARTESMSSASKNRYIPRILLVCTGCGFATVVCPARLDVMMSYRTVQLWF